MSKNNDLPAAGTTPAAQRRDRAQRMRRRITSTVAATGVGTVAAFGVLAATHNPGTSAVAATTANQAPSAAATAAPAASASSSAAAATAAPTLTPATAAPVATAAPTAQAVTGGSGG